MIMITLTSLLHDLLFSTIARLPSPHKTSPISTLPTEILIHILKDLHCRGDLRSCVLVSRRWCECAVELLWYNPLFPLNASAFDIKKLASVLGRQHQTFIYSRFIRGLDMMLANVGDDLFSGFSRCENLENLNLSRCKHLTGEGLAKVLPHFTNLVAIDLSWVFNTTSESVIGLAKVATRLQNVNLRGCTEVTDDAVLALAASCPLLRRLDLYGLILLTDNAISSLALSCPMLVKLCLDHCKLITDASVRLIWQHLIHMNELSLSHCPLLTDAAFPAPLMLGVQLEASKIFETYSATKKHDLLSPIAIREHLWILDVSGCSLITDNAIEGVVSHAPKIEVVVLLGCVRVERVESICHKLNRETPNFIH